MFLSRRPNRLTTAEESLRGRPVRSFAVPERHAVLGTPLEGPVPDGAEVAHFGLGCFWGAERLFWQTPGVVSTSVGYQGGHTPNPTYDEVCTGRTAHTEAVRVVFDPAVVPYGELLRVFWEGHDPTQGFRQGHDRGTQYRSAIYWTSEAQRAAAVASRDAYAAKLAGAGYGAVTTEIEPAESNPFFYAEAAHQQYLYKNPGGYCGLGGTGVTCA